MRDSWFELFWCSCMARHFVAFISLLKISRPMHIDSKLADTIISYVCVRRVEQFTTTCSRHSAVCCHPFHVPFIVLCNQLENIELWYTCISVRYRDNLYQWYQCHNTQHHIMRLCSCVVSWTTCHGNLRCRVKGLFLVTMPLQMGKLA